MCDVPSVHSSDHSVHGEHVHGTSWLALHVDPRPRGPELPASDTCNIPLGLRMRVTDPLGLQPKQDKIFSNGTSNIFSSL